MRPSGRGNGYSPVPVTACRCVQESRAGRSPGSAVAVGLRFFLSFFFLLFTFLVPVHFPPLSLSPVTASFRVSSRPVPSLRVSLAARSRARPVGGCCWPAARTCRSLLAAASPPRPRRAVSAWGAALRSRPCAWSRGAVPVLVTRSSPWSSLPGLRPPAPRAGRARLSGPGPAGGPRPGPVRADAARALPRARTAPRRPGVTQSWHHPGTVQRPAARGRVRHPLSGR